MGTNGNLVHHAPYPHPSTRSSVTTSAALALLSLGELITPSKAQEPQPQQPTPAVAASLDNLATLKVPNIPRLPSAGPLSLETVSLDPLVRPERPRLFFGGGVPPEAGLKLLAGWAGGQEARIVAIGWGSKIPQDYFEDFNRLLIQAGGPGAIKMPELSELKEHPQRALELAKEATGIFLMGGDQVRLLRALHTTGVAAHLRDRLNNDSLVIAGTSAGTALGSHTMIGGNGVAPEDLAEYQPVQTSKFFMLRGLGLLPKDVILEQHCLRVGRLDRLQGALENTDGARLGIGIDDGACVAVVGELTLHAIGPAQVHLVHKGSDGEIKRIRVLSDGEICKDELLIVKVAERE